MLQKELGKELKVKEGLERYLGIGQINRKLQDESKSMLDDSKAKIALLRMQIEKIQRQEQVDADLCGRAVPTKLELIADDLLHRLHKETAIAEGARNMIRILCSQKKSDMRGVTQAYDSQVQSEEKLELIRLALHKYISQFPADSPKRNEIKESIIENERSPIASGYVSHDRFSPPTSAPSSPPQESPSKTSSLPRSSFGNRGSNVYLPSLAVSGRLEVRLLGCENLLSEIPGRSPRPEVSSIIAMGADPSAVLGAINQKSKSARGIGPRTSSVATRMPQTDEVIATLRLDSKQVGTTEMRPISRRAWNQRFSIELDRSKELEFEIKYPDWRSTCAFTVVKLGDFVEPSHQSGMVLRLEPQGELFAEASLLLTQITHLHGFPIMRQILCN
ncbi:hypothetical protein AB6A40_008950 [Gnathostoma spinigerum]|uniref:REM-1 domain-containing protein n=1 Tax=Gnathostoma spinigerum TaxID=75299 RepID=A0ABD6EXN4_9BILA